MGIKKYAYFKEWIAKYFINQLTLEMDSRSERISARLRVPSTLRRVVAASSRVEWLKKRESNRDTGLVVVKLPL
jgi:hypothetical protein